MTTSRSLLNIKTKAKVSWVFYV